ncbi:protein Wnt-1-like [Tubulanus polymorphus]|uniref:protein Wnt-1-like n=1 Tax=Tubulanus polymorphus TaxID=672921 RepID=UPI003DA3C7B1
MDWLTMLKNLGIIAVILASLVPISLNASQNSTTTSNRTKKRPKLRTRGIKWWNLFNVGHISNDLRQLHKPSTFISPSLTPLTKKQRKLVTKYMGSLQAIVKGASSAVQECKYQFQHSRWNCPTAESGHGGNIFGKILRIGSRETAFIYSITSAAVSHHIARGCSDGQIYTCHCTYNRPTTGQHWQWGGCNDKAAVTFGYKFSRHFVDVVEKGRDMRYMMNLHNNEAGRLVVKQEMEKECKCHGVSGSCTMKTCWMRLPTFRKVGKILKKKYDGASKVVLGNNGNTGYRGKQKKRRKFNLIPVNSSYKKPQASDLVYYEDSPKFCDKSTSLGMGHGTKGRECNATSISVDGCEIMCCGRGFRTETYTVKERCSCTFQWCCKVHCKICSRTKLRHICL